MEPMPVPTPPIPELVNQPTATPTRKWSFDAIASVIVLILGVIVEVTADLPLSEGVAEGAGLGTLMLLVGKIVGYFTKDRNNT